MAVKTTNLEVYVKGKIVFTYTRSENEFNANDVETKVVTDSLQGDHKATPLKE